MTHETPVSFPTTDLSYIFDALGTAAADRPALAQALRDDREIREAILSDERLFEALTGDEESFVAISASAFFSILMLRARRDLESQAYTVEQDGDYAMPIFDSSDVRAFIEPNEIRDYLVAVLTSFIKVEQRYVFIRRADGKLGRLKISNVDLNALIRYCSVLEETERFEIYRRIADLCLFVSGVFAGERTWGHPAAEWADQGTAFYRLAAEHRKASETDLRPTLSAFSEHFDLAVKPLRLISNRYLGAMRDYVFGA